MLRIIINKIWGDSALVATNESLSKSTVVINNEEMYERSANFTKNITVSSYDQYKSPTFDVNKVIGQDHNTIYVKFTPSGSADKFTIRVFRNNSKIKSLTGAGSGAFMLTVPNCTNSADKYYVTVNNDAEKNLKGFLYVNTRRD